MIGQRYREKKAAVLAIWRRYQSIRGTTEDGVDPAFLAERAEALEKGKYVLAVVGETKAGKSTLINALLGERILPTDVLQSSSAVVEIFKSDEKFVEVEYADGHTEAVRDDLSTPDVDEAFEHLRKIGALQDRFRSIPTTLIDALIVQGRIAPGSPLPISELEEASGLPLSDREDLIAEYVKDRTPADIPVKVTYGFPLKYAFDDLRLVDSPGVNALGGVQIQTFDYLHKANAVLFVHSLEGPVEKGSFRDFITRVVPQRTKDVLFLVLTKSGGRSEIEVEEKLSEARSLFSREFDPQRVIHVDSILKIVSEDIRAFDSALALRRHYSEREKYYTARYKAERRQEWRDEAVTYHTKLRLLNDTLEATGEDVDHSTVEQELRRRSNFDTLEAAIEDFSRRAPELQLSEILEAVRRGYDNQLVAHTQTIELLARKKQHPQTFENEISAIQKLLEEYEHELNKFNEEVNRWYKGVNAESRGELQALKARYLDVIDEIDSDSHLGKVLHDFNDDVAAIVDAIASTIRTEYENKLNALGSAAKSAHNITFPRVDVASITSQAKQQAYRTVKVEVDDSTGRQAAGGTAVPAAAGGAIGFVLGGPLGALIGAGLGALIGGAAGAPSGQKTYREESRLDPELYLRNARSGAAAMVQKVCENTVPSIISSLVDNHVRDFRSEIGKLIKARRSALEDIKTRKRKNEELLEEIAAQERQKETVEAEMHHINEMLEDLR